jgi:pimeloyl-ACP methyl ester carboxylesterase
MQGELLEVESPDGTLLGVERVGDGPPLLAVHGGTADRTRWTPVVEPLAARFTLYLLDRRGRGDSQREGPGEYALAREAEDAVAVIEHVGEPTLLLGHSYGALVGLEVLPRTDAIPAALLYEPAFDTPGHVIAPPEFIDEFSALLATDREAALELFYTRLIGVDPTPMKSTPIWQARLAAVHTLEREGRIGLDYTCAPARFADLRTRVRVLAGELSPAPFRAAAAAAADAIPGAHLVDLPGQGHTMIDADPDGFVEQVLAFFLPA